MREFWQLIRDRGLWRVIVILFVILFTAANIVYYFEHKHNPAFGGFIDAFWWAIVTVSTVGYGDITPTSMIGKVITSLFILSGIVTVSLFTATVSSFYISKLIKEGKGLSQIKNTSHILLLGWNPAGNRIIENLIAKAADIHITMVNQLPEETVTEMLQTYKDNLSFVRGDMTREIILKRANVQDAKSVIIIPDMSPSQTEISTEEKTLLAVLTVKGLSKKTNVVVYSPSVESRPHLKRAGADAVITPEDWIASSLTAQVLTPGTNEFMNKLLFNPQEYSISQAQIPEHLKGKTYLALENAFYNEGKMLLGTIHKEETIRIDDILSDDSGYLDEFIRKKFAEAGRTNIKDNLIETKLLPDKNEIIGKSEVAIIIEKS